MRVHSLKLCVYFFSLVMDASYDGTEVTVVMEEIKEVYCYTSPGPPKKKKKYKIHGEKAKKPRLAYMFWLLLSFINKLYKELGCGRFYHSQRKCNS